MRKESQKLTQGIKSNYMYWKTDCQLYKKKKKKKHFRNELMNCTESYKSPYSPSCPDHQPPGSSSFLESAGIFVVNPWFSESLEIFGALHTF